MGRTRKRQTMTDEDLKNVLQCIEMLSGTTARVGVASRRIAASLEEGDVATAKAIAATLAESTRHVRTSLKNLHEGLKQADEDAEAATADPLGVPEPDAFDDEGEGAGDDMLEHARKAISVARLAFGARGHIESQVHQRRSTVAVTLVFEADE